MTAGMGAAMGLGLAGQMVQPGPWGATPAAAAPPPPPPPPMATVWHVAANGATQGPFDEATLRQMAAQGSLTRASMVWTAGQDAWKPAADTALSRLFAQMPPPPPPGV